MYLVGFLLSILALTEPVASSISKEHQHAARPWPNRKIVYYISSRFPAGYAAIIKAHMADIERQTCLKFEPWRKGYRNYLYIRVSENGECASPVGYVRGKQNFPVSIGCAVDKSIMTHELLHSAGLFHEQSRPDRDQHVTIHFGEISGDKVDNFYRYRPLMPYSWWKDVPYDYHSIMHYPIAFFTRRGLPVMTSIPPGKAMGTLGYMRPSDAAKVNKMYKCRDARYVPEDMCYDVYNHCYKYKNKCFSRNVQKLCRKTCRRCHLNFNADLSLSRETPDAMSKMFRQVFAKLEQTQGRVMQATEL